MTMFKGLDFAYQQVKEFHKAFGHPVGNTPTAIPEDIMQKRVNWMGEELVEALYATANNDPEKFQEMVAIFKGAISTAALKIEESGRVIENVLVDQLDAFSDVNYFNMGNFVVAGARPQPFMDIVQGANMAKLGPDGKPIIRPEDGKIMKPEGWEPPEPKLLEELNKQIEESNIPVPFLQVGQKVKVGDLNYRNYKMFHDPEENQEAVSDMIRNYEYQEVTITKATPEGYFIKEDGGQWIWTDEMFNVENPYKRLGIDPEGDTDSSSYYSS